jgi:hypothetical protein
MRREVAFVGAAAVVGAASGFLVEPDAAHVMRLAVLFAAIAVVLVAVRRVYDWQRPTTELEELLVPAHEATEWRVPQLDAARLQARAAISSADALHRFFRPVLTELTAARLSRTYGVDLDSNPDDARELVSAELWELVRPGRPEPHDTHARGLPMRRVRALVEEAERT